MPHAITPSSTRARVFLMLLTLFSFILASQIIRPLIPDTLPTTLRNKIHVMETSEEPVELIFIGSSLTHKGISPAVFDEAMSREGVRIKSFNLGDNELMPPEGYALTRQLLKENLPHWKILVIELFRLDDAWRDDDEYTRRYIWWHDFTETRCAIQSIWNEPLPEQRKNHLSRLHLRAWLLEQFNLGQLNDYARLHPESTPLTVGPKADGFVSFPFSAEFFDTNRTSTAGNLDREIRKKFLNDLNRYSNDVAHVAEKPWEAWRANPGHLVRLKEFDRDMKNRGITVVYLIHPMTNRMQPERALAREAQLKHVIGWMR
ncbi:MAG: hypothetical protein AAF492_28200 [Verrucomicrobiota bacterium]